MPRTLSEDTGKPNVKVSLTVAEAHTTDVGRRIAQIDPKLAEELKLSTGDAIEIAAEGDKTTVLNWPAYAEDYGKGLIRDRWLHTK